MKDKINKRLVATLKPAATPYEVIDDELPGFIIRVQPSGAMTYYLRYRLPSGQRGRYKIGTASKTTATQARDLAKAALVVANRGEDPQDAKREARAHTLKSFLEGEYQPWAKAHRKSGQITVDRVKGCFPDLLAKPLSEIRVMWIENWRTRRITEGVKPTTVNRDVAALRAVLSKAVDMGIIKVHPLAALRPAKQDTKAKVRFLADDEYTRLMAALDARQEKQRTDRDSFNKWCTDRGYKHRVCPDLRKVEFTDHLKPMVLASLHTGLRRGELFGLKWQNIDLAAGVLTVPGELAKSGQTRHIPMSKTALDAFTKWKEQTGGTGLVFQNEDGKRFGHVNSSWRQVLKDAKVYAFRWHDMRHDFASRLVSKGVDLNTVRELLGHSDIKMTLRYAHLAPQVKAAAVALLDEARTNVVQFPASGAEQTA